MTFQLSIIGLLLGLLLLAIPLFTAQHYGTKLAGTFLKALLRLLVMLAIAGGLCLVAIKVNSWWMSVLTVILFLLLAALLTLMGSHQKNSRLYVPILAGLTAGLLLVGTCVLLAVLGGGTAWNATVLIPIVALLLTEMSFSNGQALNTYYKGLCYHGRLYTYLRSNGASHREATDQFTRSAMRRNLLFFTRNIASLSLGLGLPLAWGLIMAGGDVLSAFVFALLFFIAAMAASTISLFACLWLARRYAFDSYDALKHSAEPALDLYQHVDESQNIKQ